MATALLIDDLTAKLGIAKGAQMWKDKMWKRETKPSHILFRLCSVVSMDSLSVFVDVVTLVSHPSSEELRAASIVPTPILGRYRFGVGSTGEVWPPCPSTRTAQVTPRPTEEDNLPVALGSRNIWGHSMAQPPPCFKGPHSSLP